jgi:hypothetical protein
MAGDSMGELAEIFKQADKELKFHYMKPYSRERKSHNFRGAIIHYLIGHSKCVNLNGYLPPALYNMIFDTDLALETMVFKDYNTTLERLAKKEGWGFKEVAEFCEKEGI